MGEPDRAGALRGHLHAIAVLGLSLLGAASLATVPALADRAERAPALALLGVAAAAVIAAIERWPRAESAAVRDVRRLRESIAARLAAREAAGQTAGTSPLSALMSDALARLDGEILPTLERIAARHDELTRHLRRYDRDLTAPDAQYLERLRGIHRRQSEALSAAVRQAANADAATLAMAQESDEAAVAGARRGPAQAAERVRRQPGRGRRLGRGELGRAAGQESSSSNRAGPRSATPSVMPRSRRIGLHLEAAWRWRPGTPARDPRSRRRDRGGRRPRRGRVRLTSPLSRPSGRLVSTPPTSP